jgi:hypothetical protein
LTIHDPAKILTDVAITLGLSGDALADSCALRDEPDLYGAVASNPTITRLIRTLADNAGQALAAINDARAATRARGNLPGPRHRTMTSIPGRQ